MELSYQEKSIWGSLIATLLVYGSYFAMGAKGSLAATIVALVIIEIVVQGALGIANRPAPKDERDRLIASKAYRFAYSVLVFGVLTIAVISEVMRPTVKMLFLALVVADVVKSVSQLAYYRRGV
jgi:uncharacterized membrane protein